MSALQIVAFLSGVAGLGATIGATVSNEWRATSRASSVITATWVLQGLWNNCAGNAIGALHCRPHHTILQLPVQRSPVCSMSGMFQEILAFILSTSGWVLVSSTLPTDYWKVSSLDGTVITTATYWSNLWKACVTDSTGVSNCKDFPSMLALDGYIQACRGLMIAAICLGFFGSIFALLGMKCTKIGGTDKNKARLPALLVYELGAALFIGWAGSILCILGGSVLCCSIAGSFSKSHSQANYIYKDDVITAPE
ncbi:Claudin-10 Oligodendrocyte-specific protein-like [Larimichthys crocea]|uniref:Claudin-10 Oligodendrocyte-specific protein-like n=1 Tax=Larimichthys crocea TaxID=215358 RepID=A0A6G0J673_LARCR|nr:Claudin-10 Oligodendrocyte-specific protein-like [Larimichthys crocea]